MRQFRHPAQVTLEGVRRQFEKWRKTKKPNSRIPEELWEAAVLLCEQYTPSKVSQVLSLNCNDLKKQIAARQASEPALVVGPASFIELSLPALSNGPEYIVEMENRHGDRMKIYLSAQQSADLVALSRAFLGAGS